MMPRCYDNALDILPSMIAPPSRRELFGWKSPLSEAHTIVMWLMDAP
jgi:hypothetical protein